MILRLHLPILPAISLAKAACNWPSLQPRLKADAVRFTRCIWELSWLLGTMLLISMVTSTAATAAGAAWSFDSANCSADLAGEMSIRFESHDSFDMSFRLPPAQKQNILDRFEVNRVEQSLIEIDNRYSRFQELRLTTSAKGSATSLVFQGHDLQFIEAVEVGRTLTLHFADIPGLLLRIDLQGSARALAAAWECVNSLPAMASNDKTMRHSPSGTIIDIRKCPVDTLTFVDSWTRAEFVVERFSTDLSYLCEGGEQKKPADNEMCQGPFGAWTLEGEYTSLYSKNKKMAMTWYVIDGVPCCEWAAASAGEKDFETVVSGAQWVSHKEMPTLEQSGLPAIIEPEDEQHQPKFMMYPARCTLP